MISKKLPKYIKIIHIITVGKYSIENVGKTYLC